MSTASKKPTWYILGAGAIGSLWACYWRKAGFPVVIITRRDEPRTQMQLVVDQQQYSFDMQSMSIDELNQSPISIKHLLISTKAQQTLNAVNAIKQHIDKKATVILLQNGMAGSQLPSLLPTQHIITAITSDGAYRSDTNTVVYAGHGTTHIGDDGSILEWLPAGDLHIACCDDIKHKQWQKLAVNCAINGLTAIYQCRNGELLNNDQARNDIASICAEVCKLGNALGFPDSEENLVQRVYETLKETANNYSSMFQDIRYQQPTEIEYLNGYICQLAEKYNISCPNNVSVVEKIKQLESC